MDGGLYLFCLVSEGENVIIELVIAEDIEPALRTALGLTMQRDGVFEVLEEDSELVV